MEKRGILMFWKNSWKTKLSLKKIQLMTDIKCVHVPFLLESATELASKEQTG